MFLLAELGGGGLEPETQQLMSLVCLGHLPETLLPLHWLVSAHLPPMLAQAVSYFTMFTVNLGFLLGQLRYLIGRSQTTLDIGRLPGALARNISVVWTVVPGFLTITTCTSAGAFLVATWTKPEIVCNPANPEVCLNTYLILPQKWRQQQTMLLKGSSWFYWGFQNYKFFSLMAFNLYPITVFVFSFQVFQNT